MEIVAIVGRSARLEVLLIKILASFDMLLNSDWLTCVRDENADNNAWS